MPVILNISYHLSKYYTILADLFKPEVEAVALQTSPPTTLLAEGILAWSAEHHCAALTDALRLARMELTILAPSSGFSRRDFCAASFPWPISSPSNCSHAPFLSTTPVSTPTSRILPSMLMPWL